MNCYRLFWVSFWIGDTILAVVSTQLRKVRRFSSYLKIGSLILPTDCQCSQPKVCIQTCQFGKIRETLPSHFRLFPPCPAHKDSEIRILFRNKESGLPSRFSLELIWKKLHPFEVFPCLQTQNRILDLGKARELSFFAGGEAIGNFML